jgi:WD40 repeat protein
VDGSVRVWDVRTQREVRRLPLSDEIQVTALAPSPNGQLIFVAGWDKKKAKSLWKAWAAATGKLVHEETGLPGYVPKLALAPDGGSLALAMGAADPKDCTELRLYAGPRWHEVRRWHAHEGDDLGRCSVAFSPDGKTIATGGADQKVRRWDAATGKEIGPAIEPFQGHSQNVAYLDADTLFTFGWQHTVSFWDPITGKRRRALAASESPVTALAYSPDGRYLAVGGEGGEPIRVWDTASGKPVALLRDGLFDVTCLRFGPAVTTLISADYGQAIRQWDWAKGGALVKRVTEHGSIARSYAFSPDGKSLATGDDTGVVRVWDVATGRLAHTLRSQGLAAESFVSALAFTPDGQGLLRSSTGDGVRRWDLATGKEEQLVRQELLGPSNTVSGLAISPACCWVYACGYDGSLCVFEAITGRIARVLAGPKPSYNSPVAIALSPDGARLARVFASDWEDRSVWLWDLTTGQKIAALSGHRAPVTGLAFSPDGRRLASGSADTTVLLWDVSRLGSGSPAVDEQPLARLWKGLEADDPKVAYAAVCQGTAAGDAAVVRLKLDLRPAPALDAARIADLVHQLDSEEFVQREQASRALADLGPAAERVLRAARAKAGSLEIKRRLEGILSGQESEHRRLARAVELVEMIGTLAARGLLADLAKGGSDARLTREARMALARLELRPQ